MKPPAGVNVSVETGGTGDAFGLRPADPKVPALESEDGAVEDAAAG
jgi:hypothetical protein